MNLIKLLLTPQVNLEVIQQIEDVSAWLAETLPETIKANSQELVKG